MRFLGLLGLGIIGFILYCVGKASAVVQSSDIAQPATVQPQPTTVPQIAQPGKVTVSVATFNAQKEAPYYVKSVAAVAPNTSYSSSLLPETRQMQRFS